MKRTASLVLLLLLVLAALPASLAVQAQGTPRISVHSVYTLDRYGFATVNETVSFFNNGTSAVQAPALTFGFGNLSSMVAAYNLTIPGGFALSAPASQGGPFTIGGASIPAGGNASYVFSVLLNGVVSKMTNGSLRVLTLSSPSISSKVDVLSNAVVMPSSTSFRSPPPGFKANGGGTSNNYTSSSSEVTPNAATWPGVIATSSIQDFNPLHIFSATRTIVVSSNGNPIVSDTVAFQNMGTTPLSLLYVDILAPSNAKVTVQTGTEPRLVNPVTFSLSNGAIPLSYFASGYPTAGVPGGENFTITYQYALGVNRYSISGGEVTVRVPDAPPIRAMIDSFAIRLSLPQGASSSQSAPTILSNVTPWQGDTTRFSYSLGFGWAINAGIPASSLIFLLLLLGLFVSRSTAAQEEETEQEESSTELASGMINAFDEKTNLINSLWQEIERKDPNEVDKAYFDELRGRLDSFRSRALQRLNEVKQKSASQRFSEVVNQIQTTEREVDRAAKDKLNLYQQYHLKQMRKEVYDRLLPQYTKRLERALNQLSDELHTVQRESKLL